MATRVYSYAESRSRTTTTTTDYSVVKVTLTFACSANKSYAIFFSSVIDSSTAYPQTAKSRLRNTTSGTTLWEDVSNFDDVTATTSKRCDAGLVIHTDAGSGTSQTVQIQVASSVNTTTLGVAESSIFVLELIPNADVWTSSAGISTYSSSTYASKITLSWTPGSAGTYFNVLSGGIKPQDVSPWTSPWVRVNSTGNAYTNVHEAHDWFSLTAYNAYVGGSIMTNVTGAQTCALQVRPAADTHQIAIRDAHGVALRLDQFDGSFTNYDSVSHGTTTTTYAAAATVTGTPVAQEYLVLGYGDATNSEENQTNALALLMNIGGSNVETTICAMRPYNRKMSWFSVYKYTATAASTTWRTMYARPTGSTSVSTQYNAIGAFQLVADVETFTARLAPDTIAGNANLSNVAVANIQDDPDSPDGSWLTATSATTSTALRVTFPTPSGPPYGAQNFRLLLRKTTGATTPTVDVQLYQNGSLNSLLLDNTAITNTTGQVVQADWLASALTGTVNGSDVECRVESTVGANADTFGALPAYSAVGTAFTSATMAGTNNVAIPAHASGDLLVLHVLTRNTNQDGVLASINTANWTQAGGAGTVYGGTQNARVGFGWKIGDGTETVVSITTTGGATSDRLLARVYLFTAANGFATPPVSNISTATTGSSLNLGMPTVATTNGGNQLAVALLASSVSSTVAEATGETGGNWAEPVAESTGTNGVIAIQVSDQSASASISGGTATLGTTGVWVAVGFSVNPTVTPGAAVNTVEIGAVEWNVSYTAVEGGVISGIFGDSGIFGGRILHQPM